MSIYCSKCMLQLMIKHIVWYGVECANCCPKVCMIHVSRVTSGTSSTRYKNKHLTPGRRSVHGGTKCLMLLLYRISMGLICFRLFCSASGWCLVLSIVTASKTGGRMCTIVTRVPYIRRMPADHTSPESCA